MLSNNVQIGTTILHQLGGGRFSFFTGCKNYVALENGLQFKVGRNGKKITHCKIILTAMDDYTIEYFYVKRSDIRTLKTVLKQEQISCDMLEKSFFEATGLYTNMPA